ncbi:hypothetical protein ACJJTC_011200 [Scirpophaga incertulas]
MYRKIATANVLYGFFNTLFFASGFAKVVCGFLLLCDSQRILLSGLLVSPEEELDQPPFYFLALALLAVGLAVCATAAMGCWATYMPGYIILTFYFLIVLSLLLCECAAGVGAAVWPRCLGLQNARGGAVGALQAYYALPDYEQFTAAVDLAQTQLECCGMYDGRDYDASAWRLQGLGPRALSVPPSCCVQRAPAAALSPRPLNLTLLPGAARPALQAPAGTVPWLTVSGPTRATGTRRYGTVAHRVAERAAVVLRAARARRRAQPAPAQPHLLPGAARPALQAPAGTVPWLTVSGPTRATGTRRYGTVAHRVAERAAVVLRAARARRRAQPAPAQPHLLPGAARPALQAPAGTVPWLTVSGPTRATGTRRYGTVAHRVAERAAVVLRAARARRRAQPAPAQPHLLPGAARPALQAPAGTVPWLTVSGPTRATGTRRYGTVAHRVAERAAVVLRAARAPPPRSARARSTSPTARSGPTRATGTRRSGPTRATGTRRYGTVAHRVAERAAVVLRAARARRRAQPAPAQPHLLPGAARPALQAPAGTVPWLTVSGPTRATGTRRYGTVAHRVAERAAVVLRAARARRRAQPAPAQPHLLPGAARPALQAPAGTVPWLTERPDPRYRHPPVRYRGSPCS